MDAAAEMAGKGQVANDGHFIEQVRRFENEWQRQHRTFPTQGTGSAAKQVHTTLVKYQKIAEETCAAPNFNPSA